MDHDQIIELVPLYALDALDGDETRQVESHLETCPGCTAELAGFQSVTSGFIPDEEPPSGLWERIATEIARPGAATRLAHIEDPPRHRLRWLGYAAAVTALVVGAVAVLQTVLDDDLTGPAAVLAAAEGAARQPGAIVVEFSTETGAVAELILTADGEGFFLPTDLAPLETDRTYQLWVVTPDEQVISAGIFGNQPAPGRFTWTGDVAGFALTREVEGGVVSSAGDVVAAIDL